MGDMAPSSTDRGVLDREDTGSRKETSSEDPGATNGYQQDASLADESKAGKKKEKKPGFIKKTWTNLGLDVPTILMMGKAALPPTIAMAMMQADGPAKLYSTLGYLVAIITFMAFCIMPRAKFIQTVILNVLGTCLGAALALLMVWSGVKARQHTTTPGAAPQRYNSSQSAVLGVWLFFQVYVVNAMKAKFPQLAFPTIVYAILVNVAATNGVLFTTVAQCESFVKRLLTAFLTAFAIAAGVSLFVIPVSCRTVMSKQVVGYIGLLRSTLGAHKAYMYTMEGGDMFGQTYVPEGEEGGSEDKESKPKEKPEVAAIKKLSGALQELHGKLTADLPFAKREIAYGKLTPDDLEGIFKHLRSLLQPVLGLGSVLDLFERATEIEHWNGEGIEVNEEEHLKAVKEWNELFQFIHEPLNTILEALDAGLEHVMLKLELVKPPKKKKKGQSQDDAEAKGDVVKPGDTDFAIYFEKQAALFLSTKEPTLRHWVQSKGITLRDDYFSCPSDIDDENLKLLPSITTRKRDQRQLFMILHIMFLLNSVSHSTLEFVKFADERDQTVVKKKLIWPGGRRFKKWVCSIFGNQDTNHADETTIAGLDSNSTTVNMGEAYKNKKDPEHLPPANAWEKFGDSIRGVSHFLRSPESAFGFRAACATMSLAILVFLRDTQTFFIEQRLVWALIMVSISMTPTAGQSMFQFTLRILGTAVAMVIAWLVWYIPGQQTAGILVLLWFFVAVMFYIPIKRFDLVIVGIISVVTASMIIGYELQVRKLGVTVATASTGQPAYPIYELGPYRLATVTGGIAVAFFWTIFPFPITEHSALRQKLGGALYLSANFYSIMHEQVTARIRGDAGDEEDDKKSPGYMLIKARNKVYAKQMLTLQGLKMHSNFVNWEFPLGGKFPKDEYMKIITHVTNIINYTAMLGYASQAFTHPDLNPKPQPDSADPTSPLANAEDQLNEQFPLHASPQWFQDFRRVFRDANVTSHEITSLLAMLSSSITNGQPLPPYLHGPALFGLNSKLALVDPEIMSLRHITEPGYAAFAVSHLLVRGINV